ncbi:MAG: ArnT family glycosyltransferase [Nitrospiraceae bacterium]
MIGRSQGMGWMLVLIAAALAVRVGLFFGGVRGSDAYAYAHQAYNIATGQYDVQAEAMFYGFRYTVLLPTALAYKVAGVRDWSSALFPVVASLVTLWLIIRLGSRLLDERTGLLAGLLYVFFPLDLPEATLVGPDSFIPMLSAGSVLAFWVAGDEGKATRKSIALYALSGICVGLAAQARESCVLLLGSLACLALYRRRWDAGLLALLPGCLAPLAVEAIYYWMYTGDPMYRATVIQKLNELYVGPAPEGPTSWAYYPLAMFGLDLGGFARFGFFVYAALGSVAVAAWRKQLGCLTPLLLWAIPPLLYLEFGSMTLLRYVPIVKSYHYMSLISPPLVLLSAYGLSGLLRPAAGSVSQPLWRRTAVGVMIVGLALTSLYGAYRVRQNLQDDARPFVLVAESVQEHPERPIYVPHLRWAMFLNYHLRYQTGFNYYSRPNGVGSGRLRYLWEAPDPTVLPAAYVVLHDRYLFYDTIGRPVGRNARLPDYVFSPPLSWRVVVRDRADPPYNSFVLYETGRSADVTRTTPCCAG